MISFKHYINEIQNSNSWKALLAKPHSQDAIEDYFDIYRNKLSSMYHELVSGKKQHFNLIKPDELVRIYKEHQELGFIKSEKLFDKIIQTCIENTAQLRANTLLAGHTNEDPYQTYIDEYNDDTELSEDEFYELADNYVPNDKYSDYGLKWAEDVVIRLIDARNDNQKIILLNHLFDIVHQRSDFSEYYVVGGSSTLSKISGTEKGLE